jgi:hypothetical protein
MAFSNPLYIDIGGNGAYDPSDFDSDRDGCTNQQELGPNELLGGRRSPSNPSDFFDPDKTPASLRRHRIGDVLAVIGKYFVDVSDPPSYSTQYDRTYLGPNVWNLGLPNGQIRIDDVLAAVGSYFHDCV